MFEIVEAIFVFPGIMLLFTVRFGRIPSFLHFGIYGLGYAVSCPSYGIILYIIPWAHSIAILSKGLYPQTYASNALTRDLPYGGIAMDLVFHFGFLIVVILVCLFIASKVFEREGILT